LSQPAYINEMVDTYKLNPDFHPITPMLSVDRHPLSDTNTLMSPKYIELYQSKVGTLLYLANQTRPDILYAVNMHSRYCKSPRMHDMTTINHLLQYCIGTPEMGLTFTSANDITLYASVDASYGNHDDRRSHTGCTLHLGATSGAFISRSRKQTVTADSSTVAEFIACHTAAQEIMWARSMLTELGYPQNHPTVMYEDNKSTIHMLHNDSHTAKTKHIDIRYNLIREQVRNGEINPVHCPTESMTADILTKALVPTPYVRLRDQLLGELRACLVRICQRLEYDYMTIIPT
jgi:hypothetical protein